MLKLYPSPFPGTPSKLELSDLFLLSPVTFTKLFGYPIREAWKEIGKESLFRRMEYSIKTRTPPSRKLIEELIRCVPPSQYGRRIAAALEGDEDAMAYAETIGYWGSSFAGVFKDLPQNEYSLRAKYLCNLEEALKVPTQLALQCHFSEALGAIEESDIARLLLWPGARNAILDARQVNDLLPVRVAVALEASLSVLAAWDVENAVPAMVVEVTEVPSLMPVLPDPDLPKSNPTTQLFRWLKRTVGFSSIGEFADDLCEFDIQVSVSTLKRWSSGATLPDEKLLRKIGEAYFTNAEMEQMERLVSAARYLSLLGHIAATCIDGVSRLQGEDATRRTLPWPCLPFDQSTFADWCQARYPVWYGYHLEQWAQADR